MPKERQEYKPIKRDSKGNYIPEKDHNSIKGEWYIRVFVHEDKNGSQQVHRNAKRYLLPKDGKLDEKPIPYKDFLYTKGKKPKLRSETAVAKDILRTIKIFKQNLGLESKIDESNHLQSFVQDPKRISYLWSLYEKYLKETVSIKTFEDFDESTIKNRGHSFRRYKQIYGDHIIDNFPKNMERDFMLKAKKLPHKKDSSKRVSVMTVRSDGITLNQFFEWISKEELVQGRAKKLKLPAKSLKPQTVIPSLDSRIRIESTLTKLIEKWSLKERNKSSNRTSELKRYRTLLRIYLLADYCALRREEIWSLPLEHIDLSNRVIHIKPVDADGGTNKDGNKIRVKFNSKSNRPDFVIMEDYVYKFLSEDLKSRDLKKEVWYLDKGDGSNWFASRDGLTKAMTRLKKDLGVEGKPCH